MYQIKGIGAIIARWPFIGTIIAIMPTEAATHNRKEGTLMKHIVSTGLGLPP